MVGGREALVLTDVMIEVGKLELGIKFLLLIGRSKAYLLHHATSQNECS